VVKTGMSSEKEILCNVLEIKVYMFVFHYFPQQLFNTFFILTNTYLII